MNPDDGGHRRRRRGGRGRYGPPSSPDGR
jgi:hypothetical protein